MGAITRSLVRRDPSAITIQKDRQASPGKLPEGSVSAAYTWDGRVPVQNARIYKHWAKTSEWVRGAIVIRKSQVSSAEWDIGPYDQTKPWSKREALRIKKLFKTPNPANDSYRTFIEPIIEDLLTLDAGCIEKVRTLSGDLVEMWPVNAEHVRVDALWEGSPNTARYYWYPDGFQPSARWRNDDFVYMMANPRTDSPVGLPPLETLRAAVEAELAAHEYNRRQVENAAPDGIINLGEGFTEPQVNRFREFFEAEVAGRGPLGFIGGSKSPSFIKFRDSNRDQQFLEWQIYLVRKIAVVYGVTPQDLGVTFDINRSTAETQIQISEDRGLRPLMSLIQEYLTEEIVWDPSFGGPANNLAFRFTALNLKESTAKANIYEKALAGVPWRFINEARIDEGREPIPEMEGKLIMATPQGAVDISDVPTVRELLEMQQASKQQAAASSKSGDDIVASIAELIAPLVERQQPQMDYGDIVASISSLIRDHMDHDQKTAALQLEALGSVIGIQKAEAERPIAISLSAEAESMRELASQVNKAVAALAEQEPPVVNVEAPVVNYEAPSITVEAPVVDTAPLAKVIAGLKEALARQAEEPKAPSPVIRREVKRDPNGRIIEVIDHRGE
jgi:phage portal protein BeeE